MKFDLNKFVCKKTHPAILIDVPQDATEVGKLGNDELVLESLRYQLEVDLDSPGEKISSTFLINILRDNCLANCSLLSESDSTVEKVESCNI